MKQILITIAILFCLQSISYASKSQTVFSQLAEINTYWNQFKPEIKGLQTQFVFASEQQKIQTHLLYVEKYLRSLPTYLLTTIQIKNRNHCLDILLKYANQGLFPKNTHHPGQRIPYFIDDVKTPCAVGHLIIETGFEAVAQKINQENNYGYIKDLVNQYPEIFDWAKINGFSVDELAWIQPCYGGNGGGNNGYGGTFPFLLSDSSVIRNPSCAGKVDGFISIDSNLFATSPKPLVATISFINNYGSVGTSVSLSKDVYTITVTDAVNASTVSIFTLTDTAIVLLPTLSNTFNICNSFDTNASITITNVSGGVGPYTYGIVPIDKWKFIYRVRKFKLSCICKRYKWMQSYTTS
jgi:hypothetical protein